MTANSMLARARRDLGMRGRPNAISRSYSARNGSAFLRAPWCNMAVTEWSRDSGNFRATNFGTDYAYTVWHAQRFQQAGRWTFGTSGIRAGDVIFFDWRGSRTVGGIDHVGVVESVLSGGRVQCIEGNTSDACLRRIRSGSIITGYGRPDYTNTGGGAVTEGEEMLGLKKGDKGPAVRLLQYRVRLAGTKYANLLGKFGANKDGVDGDYGNATEKAVAAVRKDYGSTSPQGRTVSEYTVGQIEAMFVRNQAKR